MNSVRSAKEHVVNQLKQNIAHSWEAHSVHKIIIHEAHDYFAIFATAQNKSLLLTFIVTY